MLRINRWLLWLLYCLEIALFSRLILKTTQISKLLDIPEVNAINDWIVSVIIILFAVFGATFIIFILKNLMRVIFPESNSYKKIQSIYLISSIIASFLSIVSISIFPNISYTFLSKFINIISFMILNIYFYYICRNHKESILVFIVSLLNSSISFFI